MTSFRAFRRIHSLSWIHSLVISITDSCGLQEFHRVGELHQFVPEAMDAYTKELSSIERSGGRRFVIWTGRSLISTRD